MKNIILIILLTATIKSECYDFQIITKIIENQYLKVNIKNNSKKTLIFYNGDFESILKITDENGIENTGEITSMFSGEDYLDYQFEYSKSLINKTMKKYSISFHDAVIYLHYRKKYILIMPNMTMDVDLPIVNRKYKMAYKLDSTKSYFLTIATIFSTEYIPKYVKDSLESKNVQIITPKINSNKININIDKFFRKHKHFYMK
ncbi:hypothetical protein [Chryseobacterium culicis]|uniref:hypothetical protein n=1 Tax=Chryseobacterium culicis TaxID=680127 RepID=UPI001873F6FD|nr:hypothetical protein [Chryseobacterium culicis]MBE4950112.1 hypothetical protein [Chryseobacterium culicis]